MRTRSVGLNVRVSPAEKYRIQTAAGRCGLTARMDNLTDQLARLDPPLAEEYRRCREGLLDSLLRKEDASGDH